MKVLRAERVTSEDYFRFLYPGENYFDMWHYEFLGIVDDVTMQLNKGGKWPTLWRCKLWKFLEKNEVHFADYLEGQYVAPKMIDVLDFEPCDTEETLKHAGPTRVIPRVEGFCTRRIEEPRVAVTKHTLGKLSEDEVDEFIANLLA